MADAREPIFLLPEDGEPIGTNRIKAARPELSLLELEVGPGGGVQPHFHKGHSDSFYVLEGDLEFRIGDEIVSAPAGSYVLAPPRVVHAFRNAGTERARALNLHTPGGFVEYRRELEALRAQGIEPHDAFFEHHDIFDV